MRKANLILMASLLMAIVALQACRKESSTDTPPCNGCNCQSLVTTYEALPATTDSLRAIQQIQGRWHLQCIKFYSRYGQVVYDTARALSVQFSDTAYSYYQNDTLLFTYPYVAHGASLYSNGNSFYYGILGPTAVTYKDSMLGLNTVYPYTGSYYLLFKQQ